MSCCLICGVVASPPERPAPVLSSNSGIQRKICLFHKVLQIPLSKCLEWLDGSELTFCEGCHSLVDQGMTLFHLMDKLKGQMKEVQVQLSALLLKQKQQNEVNNEGQENTLRSSLISEIRLGLKLDGTGGVIDNPEELRPAAGVMAQGQIDQVHLMEEDEWGDGIGIITETISLSSPYQCQGGVGKEIHIPVLNQNQGGVETSKDLANVCMSSQQNVVTLGADTLGEETVEYQDNTENYSHPNLCQDEYEDGLNEEEGAVNGELGDCGDVVKDEDDNMEEGDFNIALNTSSSSGPSHHGSSRKKENKLSTTPKPVCRTSSSGLDLGRVTVHNIAHLHGRPRRKYPGLGCTKGKLSRFEPELRLEKRRLRQEHNFRTYKKKDWSHVGSRPDKPKRTDRDIHATTAERFRIVSQSAKDSEGVIAQQRPSRRKNRILNDNEGSMTDS